MATQHYIVSCEFRGKRRDTVEIPVSVDGGHGAMVACEQAERIAFTEFGGRLNEWFAWKVVPDEE